MFRHKYVLMSGLLLLILMFNFADAADQSYIVSFVAGEQAVGLVSVKQNGSEIKVTQPSITRLESTFGSTAVVSFRSAWDGDLFYDVYVTYAGDAAKPIKAKALSFSGDLTGPFHESEVQSPGQYHPLHLFRPIDQIRFLAAGSFGTARANDYVSYPLYSSTKETIIFANPDNRSAATAAVSPDGGLITQMTYKGLNHIAFGRILNSNGNPIGQPFQFFNMNDFQGYSQSLSNPIASASSSIRYLAYRNFKEPGTANSKSQVVIRNVGAKTGLPKGKLRFITNFEKALNVEAEKFQSIAIAPDGEVILYTVWSNSCKKQILVARRLVNGSTAGSPKVIVGCRILEQYEVGVYGISIAEVAQ
jgi:hypothetical protein